MFELNLEGNFLHASFKEEYVKSEDCLLVISSAMRISNVKVILDLSRLKRFSQECDLLNLIFLIRSLRVRDIGFIIEGVNPFVEALLGEFILDVGVFVNR